MNQTPGRDWTWGVITVFLFLQIPFLNGAIRIDETNILAIAQQIRKEPLRGYDFMINWQGMPERAFDILANPPGVPYYLAAVTALFGEQELPLRIAMLPFAVVALWGSALVASAFGIPRFIGALAVALSPGFFTAAPLTMPDIAMLGAFTIAIGSTLRYIDGGRRRDLVLAIVAGFLAPLLKYNGILLIPILGFVWLLTPRRSTGAMLAMLSPLAALVAWSTVSWVIYREIHFLAITAFEGQSVPWMMLSSAVIYLGLSVVPFPGTFAPLRRRFEWVEALFLAGSLVAFVSLAYSLFYMGTELVIAAIAGALGARIIPEVLLRTLPGEGDRIRRFLPLLWLAIAVFFVLRLNFNSTRYMLPLLPLAGILLVGRTWAHSRTWTAITAALAVVLAIGVARADASSAAIYRDIARTEIPRLYAAGAERVFYAGHWGWQWYAERAGAIQVDEGDPPDWRAGDVLILPRYTATPMLPPKSRDVVFDVRQIEFRRPRSIQTIDQETAANLYATGLIQFGRWTFLPFSFGDGIPERFRIFTARERVAGDPETAPSRERPEGVAEER